MALENYNNLEVVELKVEDYERVLKISYKNEFVAYISIHNTSRGPSVGGCRCWHYPHTEDAFSDALALSRAMSYKNAMADLNVGGGKSVINTVNFKNHTKKLEYLEIIGHVLNYIGGDYIIAEDMNVSCVDLDVVRRVSKHVAPKIAGDPGPVTAEGVFLGINEVVPELLEKNPSEISVLVQGVGSVGANLVEKLLNTGYIVYISDINEEVYKKFPNATPVHPDEIFNFKYDIFSPCAFGGIVNKINLEKMKKNGIKVIAGSANNQLSSNSLGWDILKNNIIYLPDFIINAGGVIQVVGVTSDDEYNHLLVERKLKVIPENLKRIIKESQENRLPTNFVAIKMAKEKLRIV